MLRCLLLVGFLSDHLCQFSDSQRTRSLQDHHERLISVLLDMSGWLKGNLDSFSSCFGDKTIVMKRLCTKWKSTFPCHLNRFYNNKFHKLNDSFVSTFHFHLGPFMGFSPLYGKCFSAQCLLFNAIDSAANHLSLFIYLFSYFDLRVFIMAIFFIFSFSCRKWVIYHCSYLHEAKTKNSRIKIQDGSIG